MSNTSQRARREQIATRVDPEIVETIERVAEAERRPVSSLVRNVLTDWARDRQPQAVGGSR